ncbi:neurotrimin-like isoform X1 [Neodiprion virginianus]|uniref:Neurotrimin-like isoform X1 n=1 Tax=Neodiprion lecontei TaxID=441921 RepID=A0ABM3FQT0_NEOLC|nr:neurotrimin-like isoform X1 [Neodiprion lecontei]XP_046610750.1 neurotrimin-like isoform X1 [Neodiprion virginianus]
MLGYTFLAICVASWVSALIDPAPVLPKFGKPLDNLTVSVGREATFTCIVEDLGLYKVAWLRVDTQTILTIASHVITKNHRIAVTHSGHRTWSLHIRDTRETDRGWYMCQVNTDPMSSNTGFLDVVVPPDILDYPTSTDMVVREGSNVTLRCAATGTPTPSVTWRREDGNPIIEFSTQEATSTEGPELEIVRVSRRHMGPYLCIASNGVPPTVSKRIVLIVHFPPKVWVGKQLEGVYEGQTVTLACRSEAFPRPITYWTRPTNEIIINDDNFKIASSSTGYESVIELTIRAVQLQDLGTFKCVAKNALGETEDTIKLNRIAAPSTTHRPNARRESKKSWISEFNQEKKAAATKGSSMGNGIDNGDGDEELTDFDSATSSSTTSRHLLVLGMATIITILGGRFPT